MLDETALRVLEEYVRDSRQSYREIARRLGISSGTVASRAKELEEKGIIEKYTVQLNHEKLGYELTAITEIIISEGMMLEVGDEISKISGALRVYNITGDADILVVARFKTRSQLSDFTKKITKMRYVVRTKTHVVLNTIKDEVSLLP
ncbi:winged helix-turn-helix transcriptional regulator [Candidatus Bathyarchaeota archaeon]|nr:winged helix-turn-helix transcriptional regulator [Candidatus Bathyarchaeota archaeon]